MRWSAGRTSQGGICRCACADDLPGRRPAYQGEAVGSVSRLAPPAAHAVRAAFLGSAGNGRPGGRLTRLPGWLPGRVGPAGCRACGRQRGPLAVGRLSAGGADPGGAASRRCRRPQAARGLSIVGLLGYAVVVGGAAALSSRTPSGTPAALAWAALLVGAIALFLGLSSQGRLFHVAGALVSALLLVGADCWPTTAGPPLPGWAALRHGSGWQAARGLLLLSGYAALALAWPWAT